MVIVYREQSSMESKEKDFWLDIQNCSDILIMIYI